MGAIYPDVRESMLQAGTFVIDGWTSSRGREEARRMREEGLLHIEERGSDEAQYTYLLCTVIKTTATPTS